MSTTPPTEDLAPARRPTILLGCGAATFGRPDVSVASARRAGLHGMDLDLRASWRSPSIEEISESPPARIRSVWLPVQYSGPFRENRAERLRSFLNHAAEHCGLSTIVLAKNIPVRNQGIPLSRMAQQVAEWYGIRTAIGITASSMMLDSGSHLQRIANMRRIAEEWDLDIALDLTTPGIEHWEAEAALMRLFPRLRIVRMRPLRQGHDADFLLPTSRAAARTTSMLADQTYREFISITPALPQWPWLRAIQRPNLLAVTETRAEILAAYDRVHYYMRQDQRSTRRPN